MGKAEFSKEYISGHQKRFKKTLDVLFQTVPPPANILDVGPPNPFTKIMEDSGYTVTNTPSGVDLDYHADSEIIKSDEYDAVTSFEIFEHLVNPFGVLSNIGSDLLITTVPLKLWFSPDAYWNENDEYDRHYHEFEPRQFDMLLEKANWNIIHTEKWSFPSNKFGLRPFLRRFYPRYYMVVAKREKSK